MAPSRCVPTHTGAVLDELLADGNDEVAAVVKLHNDAVRGGPLHRALLGDDGRTHLMATHTHTHTNTGIIGTVTLAIRTDTETCHPSLRAYNAAGTEFPFRTKAEMHDFCSKTKTYAVH